MSSFGRATSSNLSKGLALALAAALLPVSSLAQTRQPLRGAVFEGEVRRSLIDRPTPAEQPSRLEELQNTAPVPEYRPTVADEEGESRPGASIFGEADEDDAFSDMATPAVGARPASARQRAEEARASRTAPPQSVAERIEEQRGVEASADDAEPADITGTVRGEAIDALDLERSSAAEPADARVAAIEEREGDPEEDPYAPLGIRVGTFDVTATLDQLIGHSTNPDFSQGGRSATISETALRLNAVSNWSRHRARIDAYGIYRRSIAGEEVSDEEAGIDGALDLDLAGDYAASAAIGYSIRPESASSPVDFSGAVSRPLRQTLTASLGAAKDEGKLRLGLTGDIERSWYGDAELSAGGTLSQKDRNYTLATVTLRTGYEISPALVPFAEAEFGRRFYELDLDANGFDRSSNRLGLRGGTAFDFGEKLSGEVAVGWLRETIDDDRLEPISGATVDAVVAWSPVRGTVVNFLGSTTVEGTTTAAESGSILYSGTVRVDRELRANLTGTASLGGYYRDYAGTSGYDRGIIAEAGATYWLNRYAGLTGRARYEIMESNLPGRDADAASVFAGVRLQR